MNVKDEIEKYSSEADKPVLRWLFGRYHWASEWQMMASCNFGGHFMRGTSHRIWAPTPVGAKLYEHARMKTALQFYANAENWKEIPTGIGMMNSPAVDDFGATAREALA